MPTPAVKNRTIVRDIPSHEMEPVSPQLTVVADATPSSAAVNRRQSSGSRSKSLHWMMLRAGLRASDAISPALTARWVERIWLTPPHASIRPEAEVFLDTGQRLHLRLAHCDVAAWNWGPDCAPTIVLMHGWGGYAGQMQAFVAPLIAAGFRVVAFDAPGHGRSGPSRLGGPRSSFVEVAAALRELTDAIGPITGLVAHSGACAAAALALREGMRMPERMVFLAPFVRPSSYLRPFCDALGVSARVAANVHDLIERRYRREWSEFDLIGLPVVRELPPLLLIHDRSDAEIPYADGEALAAVWPQARLLTTHALGHRKLLRDPDVVAQATRYLARVAATAVAMPDFQAAAPASARGELDMNYEHSDLAR